MCEDMSSVPGSCGHVLLFGIQLLVEPIPSVFSLCGAVVTSAPCMVERGNPQSSNGCDGPRASMSCHCYVSFFSSAHQILLLLRHVWRPHRVQHFASRLRSSRLADFHFFFFCRKSFHQRAYRSPSGLRQTCTVLTRLCSGDRTHLSSLIDGACLKLCDLAPRVCARDISRVSPVTHSLALPNQIPLSHGSVFDTTSCGKWSEHSTWNSEFGSNHFG